MERVSGRELAWSRVSSGGGSRAQSRTKISKKLPVESLKREPNKNIKARGLSRDLSRTTNRASDRAPAIWTAGIWTAALEFDHEQKALFRATLDLEEAGLIGLAAEYVWLAGQRDMRDKSGF
jgi:hypothetical protein